MLQNLYAKGTFTGHYLVSPPKQLLKADYITAHEFAAPKDNSSFGIAQDALARFTVERYEGAEVYAAPSIAGAIKKIAPRFDLAGVFEMGSSNTLNTEGGTWGEIQQGKRLAGAERLHPLQVGVANHVGRIALQAKNAGLLPVLPPGLPAIFDRDSKQWWCRNPALWSAHEIIGVPFLKFKKQI